MNTWIWIAVACCGALISGLLAAFFIRRRLLKKVKYIFDAFEDGEMNFHFKETSEINKTLNRLRGIYEKRRIANEQESWTKLFRVLTHEIMNTLTPIVSLSDALSANIENNSESDIKEGLEIISDSSRNLMNFISKYRQITGLSRPVRKDADIRTTIDKILKLNAETFSQNGINLEISFPTEPVNLQIDEIQIKQVIQNLLKNAVEANATEIYIILKRLSDDSTLLWIKNNGKAIPHEIREQIFIPFYTTKTNGSGIGLSVSRQIIRSHNGSLNLLKSNSAETVFEIIFN